MNVRKKKLCAGMVLLSSAFAGIVPMSAYALNGLSAPLNKPVEVESDWENWKKSYGGDYSDLIGVYYAEGTGLEIELTCQILRGTGGFTVDENGDVYVLMRLKNYNDGKELLSYTDLHKISDSQYATANGGVTLTVENDETIWADFSEEQIKEWMNSGSLLYLSVTSAEFTDAEVLEKNAVEDNWSGTYLDDSNEVSSNTTILYSLEQIYGTNDYLCFMNILQYGEETGTNSIFYTEKGTKLVHEYEAGDIYSEPVYACYEKNNHGSLGTYYSVIPESQMNNAPEPDIFYTQLSPRPQWEDDTDGYIY